MIPILIILAFIATIVLARSRIGDKLAAWVSGAESEIAADTKKLVAKIRASVSSDTAKVETVATDIEGAVKKL